MGTKANPAPNDCYAKAEDDEPMFTLLARDPQAPSLVRQWADRRNQAFWLRIDVTGSVPTPDQVAKHVRKVDEARACADAMEAWRLARKAGE